MLFYLSGGIEFKTNLGVKWREWLTDELVKIGHNTVDPLKIEEDKNIKGPVQNFLTQLKLSGQIDEVRRRTRSSLFRKDMYAIQLSDAMVLLYDRSVQRGAGTLAEAWEAFREGRPVYCVSDLPIEEIPTWLIGETTALFFSFEDFLTYVGDHSRIDKDIIIANDVRDEVLGGLYKRP